LARFSRALNKRGVEQIAIRVEANQFAVTLSSYLTKLPRTLECLPKGIRDSVAIVGNRETKEPPICSQGGQCLPSVGMNGCIEQTLTHHGPYESQGFHG